MKDFFSFFYLCSCCVTVARSGEDSRGSVTDGLSKGGGAVVAASTAPRLSNSSDGCATSASQQLNVAANTTGATCASSSSAFFGGQRHQQRFSDSGNLVSESPTSEWTDLKRHKEDNHLLYYAGSGIYDYSNDAEWLRVESWLDEHPDFCHDYFLRY